MYYDNGEEIITRTVAFKQKNNCNNVYVTIKDHYTWSVIITRAWQKLSEILEIPVKQLEHDFEIINKTDCL